MPKKKRVRYRPHPAGPPPDFSPSLVIHFDGGCNPNPGGTPRYGLVAYDPATGSEVASRSGAAEVGLPRTNNTAEFTGLWRAIELAIELCGEGSDVAIRGDSILAIHTFTRRWLCKKSPHLRYLRDKAIEAEVRHRGRLDVQWVRRNENARADQLAGVA